MKIRFFNRTEDIRFESKIGLRFSRIDSLASLTLRNSEISTDRFLLKFEKKKEKRKKRKYLRRNL